MNTRPSCFGGDVTIFEKLEGWKKKHRAAANRSQKKGDATVNHCQDKNDAEENCRNAEDEDAAAICS